MRLTTWLLSSALVLASAVALGRSGTARLRAEADDEIRALFRSTANDAPRVVVDADVARTPVPVQRWLRRAGVVGKPFAKTVRLRQRGEMHTSADAAWFPVEAEQYFTAAEPGFVWWMEGRMLGFLPLAGRDKLVSGKGEMHVTIAGLLDVADGRGPKVDEGALLRWLAEMIWFPSAALGDAVAWRPIDDTHAEATVTSRDGVSASGVFAFDRDGRVVGVDADRWFGADGPRERWSARNTEWRSIRGVEVPTRGEVTWHLQKGDFTFYRWEITDVEADCPFTSLGN